MAGRVVVVTGASAGVGRATAQTFGACGDRVALLARSAGALHDACREVEAAGGTALAIPLDVADGEAVERAADRVEQAFGPIDIWINNAMVTAFAPFEQVTDDEFRRITEVTYHGYVNGTRAALKRMKPRDQGVIVQVGSALAYRSIPLQSAYCGAKAAIRGFTDALRCELLHDQSNVRLTMVQLPAHNTPQFDWALSRMPQASQPVPPIFSPYVAARAIVFAVKAGRRELWVGWPSILAIVGGAMLAPGFADRYLGRTNYKAQQTERPTEPGRRANLFETVDGVHRTRGRFHDRERSQSLALELSMRRRSLAAGAAAALAGALVVGLLVRSGSTSKALRPSR